MGGDTGIAKLGKIALISQKELNAIGAPPSSKCKAIANKAAMEQIKYKGRDGKPIATSNARANMSKIPEDIADKMTLHG